MKKTNSLLAVLALCSVGFAVDYTPWSGHATITLNTSATGANVAGGVTNFPLLVRLSSTQAAVFAAAKADGADIRFSKADNATALPYQIEHWNQSGQVASIWVLVDAIAGNADGQQIRMHWGNASAGNESNGAAVFATANGFAAVFHLNEATGDTIRDATGSYKGVPSGPADPLNVAPGATPTSALIGNAKNFGGALGGAHVTTGGAYRILTAAGGDTRTHFDFSGTTPTFTVSAWANQSANTPDFDNNRRAIIGKGDHGTDANNPTPREWYLRNNINMGGQARYHFQPTNSTTSTNYSINVGAEADVPGKWTYLSYAAAGALSGHQFRSRNELASTNLAVTGDVPFDPVGTGRAFVVLGGFQSSNAGATDSVSHFFPGLIDEVRISTVARSQDWTDLEYASQRPTGQNLYSIGSVSPIHGAGTVRNAVFSVQASAAGVIFRMPAGEAGVLSVSDVWGRTVWSREVREGEREIAWNGTARLNGVAAKGVYLARFVPKQAGSARYADRKITLTR